MEEILLEEKIDDIEASVRGYKQSNAVLHLLVVICSPEGEKVVPDDTELTVLFELMFELVSPIGLLANLASVISIADRWRTNASTGLTVPDSWWVLTLNSFSLALGCIANLVMFLHIQLWVSREKSLSVTLGCYLVSVLSYISLLAACEYEYFGNMGHGISRTYGYWQAVCATVLYFLAGSVVLMHVWYFRNRVYNENISRRQHRLMLLCILYVAWIAIGGASFQAKTMLNTTYSEGVYFMVVSFLTLGFGDVVPPNNLSRALAIPMIYVGIVLGGLVSVCIFQATLNPAKSRSVRASVQKDRRILMSKWKDRNYRSNPGVSDRDSFEAMRHILNHRQLQQTTLRVITTSVWLFLFWLIGALIFSYTEGWGYFPSFYMCSISLVGIGYGDYVPSSSGGRSVFIHWALTALPTMSAAVSGLTSFVLILLRQRPPLIRILQRLIHKAQTSEDSEHITLEEHIHTKHVAEPKYLPNLDTWHDFLEIAESKQGTNYSYGIWGHVVRSLYGFDHLPSDFWISEDSPLRVPDIDEKRLLTLLALHIMRTNTKEDPKSSSLHESSSHETPSQRSSCPTQSE